MSKEFPYTARSRALLNHGVDHKVTMITPGKYPDGQERDGTRPENIHPDPATHYLHKDAQAYRDDLRSAPRVPMRFKDVPPEARAQGNIHQHTRRGKR